jgi:hypothetical protein
MLMLSKASKVSSSHILPEDQTIPSLDAAMRSYLCGSTHARCKPLRSTEDADKIMQARHTVCTRNNEQRTNGLVSPCEPPRPACRPNRLLLTNARN